MNQAEMPSNHINIQSKPPFNLKAQWRKILLTVIMCFFAILMITPFLWMLSASLKKPIEIFEFPIRWIPDELQFINYKNVWLNKTYPFYLFYINSLKVAFFSVIGLLLVSSTAAYAFAKIQFKGRDFIFFLYLATLMIPHQVTLVPRFILFRWLGIYDSHLALVLPAVFNILGIFMLRQFYISIPMEISESAQIDGASHVRTWYQIILPLAKPAIVSLVILGFVWNWNDYMNPLVFITSKDLYTIPVGLQVFRDDQSTNYNLIMAGASCAIFPLIIVFLLCQKYFIEGITTTGLKG